MTNYIKDNKNIPIGWVDNRANDILAYHVKKGYIGRYSKTSDITFDAKGQIYCYGDGAVALIHSVNNEYK